MFSPVVLGAFYILVLIENVVTDASGSVRQKRCIVIQKQSGTHGDNTEGEDDDDYRRPQPKEPMNDRFRKPQEKIFDVEDISPELQRFKKRLDRLRLKKPGKFSHQKDRQYN